MANSYIDSFSEETQNKLTKAMLESSILFSLNRNAALSDGRKDMFLQTVFAIICSDDVEWTWSDVRDVFKSKFGKEYDDNTIIKAMQKLLKEGWLKPRGKGFVPQDRIANEMKYENEKVIENNKALLEEIIDTVNKNLATKLDHEEKTIMERNVKEAFNLYIRMYGFESFSNNEIVPKDSVVDDDDIVKATINDLNEERGEMLVSVLSDLISKPTPKQASTIMSLVKIYLGLQIMQLDPLLSELEKNNLKGKKFVLDTDFLLYCLVSHPKQSKSYQKLLRALRKAGCELIIPEDVVMEVLKHAECAERNYNRFAKLLKSVDKAVIEEKANNVFVKDYCLYDIDAKHHQTIKQYMANNFLNDDEPLDFMKDLIKDLLRIEPGDKDLLEVDSDYLSKREELATKIFLRTRYSDSDKWRTDEEIRALSETDAKLYLSVLSLNKDIKSKKKGEMLRAKAYLVTGTTKSIKSAQEMNIHRNFVTRPELLINLLAEIGSFDDSKLEFVNLFENPFLAHILNRNWDMITNLSELGLNMHDKNITKLKNELGGVYHKYLTTNADSESIDTISDFDSIRIDQAKTFFDFAEDINELDYKFVPEVQNLIEEYKKESKGRMTAEEQRNIAEKLLAQKVHGYKIYIEKTGKKKKNMLRNKKNRENV